MTDPQQIAARYLACWNERDPARRHDLVMAAWTADASDRDPLARARGHDEIADLIGAVQARFPGWRFALAGLPDGYGTLVRFAWTLGPERGEPPVAGRDVAEILPDSRLVAVTGVLDRVPAA
jgi:hypothetical protein